jgi:hypothetical protein
MIDADCMIDAVCMIGGDTVRTEDFLAKRCRDRGSGL